MKNFDTNSNRWHQSGISSYLTVMFVAVVATFVVAVIQSRLLLGIHRNRALSDILVATYNAESEIYDIFARILEGYVTVSEVSGTKTLADGTVLDISGSGVPGSETVLIKANRPFAVQTLEGVRTSSSEEGVIGSAEIALILDCSSSMNRKDATDPNNPTGPKISRLQALKIALLGFLDLVEAQTEPGKIDIGMLAFTEGAAWLRDSYPGGQEIKPNLKLSIPELRTIVNTSFPDNARNDDSPGCYPNTGFDSGTNIGLGLVMTHVYFKDTPPPPDSKRVEILITDGHPTEHRDIGKYPHCDKLSGDKDVAFLKCGMATTGDFLETNGGVDIYGLRDPNVENYAVNIINLNPNGAVYKIYDQYATGFYIEPDAGELSGILDEIFNIIISGSEFIRIRRVIP